MEIERGGIMTTTKTIIIELNDGDISAMNRVLFIVDRISEITGMTKLAAFEYFLNKAKRNIHDNLCIDNLYRIDATKNMEES